jgi:hypothetical protein
VPANDDPSPIIDSTRATTADGAILGAAGALSATGIACAATQPVRGGAGASTTADDTGCALTGTPNEDTGKLATRLLALPCALSGIGDGSLTADIGALSLNDDTGLDTITVREDAPGHFGVTGMLTDSSGSVGPESKLAAPSCAPPVLTTVPARGSSAAFDPSDVVPVTLIVVDVVDHDGRLPLGALDAGFGPDGLTIPRVRELGDGVPVAEFAC